MQQVEKKPYVSREPDENGYINYSKEDDEIWSILMERQVEIIKHRACQEFIDGLNILNFPTHHVPQLKNVSSKLKNATGWEVYPVAALISHDKFFSLLANRQFPAATFVRHREELDYLQEPDIFHEFFGHCPLLMHQPFADFSQKIAEYALGQEKKIQIQILRLYWFTVEFGLIQTNEGLRAYGGGILSSPSETVYCIESDEPQRNPLVLLDVLRTPYRIDILQPVYYVIKSFTSLYDLIDEHFLETVAKSTTMLEFEPTFPPKNC